MQEKSDRKRKSEQNDFEEFCKARLSFNEQKGSYSSRELAIIKSDTSERDVKIIQGNGVLLYKGMNLDSLKFLPPSVKIISLTKGFWQSLFANRIQDFFDSIPQSIIWLDSTYFPSNLKDFNLPSQITFYKSKNRSEVVPASLEDCILQLKRIYICVHARGDDRPDRAQKRTKIDPSVEECRKNLPHSNFNYPKVEISREQRELPNHPGFPMGPGTYSGQAYGFFPPLFFTQLPPSPEHQFLYNQNLLLQAEIGRVNNEKNLLEQEYCKLLEEKNSLQKQNITQQLLLQSATYRSACFFMKIQEQLQEDQDKLEELTEVVERQSSGIPLDRGHYRFFDITCMKLKDRQQSPQSDQSEPSRFEPYIP